MQQYVAMFVLRSGETCIGTKKLTIIGYMQNLGGLAIWWGGQKIVIFRGVACPMREGVNFQVGGSYPSAYYDYMWLMCSLTICYN